MKDEYLQINVVIADKVYPLTVKAEEEAAARRAAAKFSERVKTMQARYTAVKSRQDVLAMVGFEMEMELDFYHNFLDNYTSRVEGELENLENSIKSEIDVQK